MKNNRLLKLIVGVVLVAALAVPLYLMSGCKPPPAAPKEITAKIGLCVPLTGEVSGWGLPGLWGAEMVVDEVNKEGGILLADGTHVMLGVVSYDDEYIPDKSLAGVQKLVLEDKVKLIMTLGGSTGPAVVPWLTQQKMLSTSLTASDLNPETLYHIIPTEPTPLEASTQFNWLKENYPELKTIALTCQDDEFGRMLMACCCASAESAGLEIVYNELYDAATTDFAPIASAMLAKHPDIFATVAAYPNHSLLLFEQAYLQGFKGRMQQGGLDLLPEMIDKTSLEFMEGTICIFPNMSDPKLTAEHHAFWDEYHQKHPGQWTTVSFEYAWDLKLWIAGVKAAGSVEPMAVFQALKSMPNPPHCFGPGKWWGRPMWGIDNVVVPDWPVCEVHNGEPLIQAFPSLIDWWNKNKEIEIKWMEDYDQMWYQKLGIPKEEAIEKYGLYE